MYKTYLHHIAIVTGRSEAVKWFYKEGGLPVNHVDANNQTSLYIICHEMDMPEKELVALAKFLVEGMHLTSIGLHDVEGKTAADLALEKGRKVLHRYMIKAEEKVKKEEEAAKAQKAAPQAEAFIMCACAPSCVLPWQQAL
jgi:hypothetical protein